MVTLSVCGQQLGKHVPGGTGTNAKIEERCFMCGPCKEVITRTVGVEFSGVLQGSL
jgi:uncharacterized CHY-type Zn-finger protein